MLELADRRARSRRPAARARRRVARGPLGIQRRVARARDRRPRPAADHRNRPRDRFHDRRFRRGPARADAVCGRGTRSPGCGGLAPGPRRAQRPASARLQCARIGRQNRGPRGSRPAAGAPASGAGGRTAHAAPRRAAVRDRSPPCAAKAPHTTRAAVAPGRRTGRRSPASRLAALSQRIDARSSRGLAPPRDTASRSRSGQRAGGGTRPRSHEPACDARPRLCDRDARFGRQGRAGIPSGAPPGTDVEARLARGRLRARVLGPKA